MLKEAIVSLLTQIGQKQLAVGLENLRHEDQETFINQLMAFGPCLLEQQRKVLFEPEKVSCFDPLDVYDSSGNDADVFLGKEKKYGCIILTGGQGSRLGVSIPKALMPVSLIKNKSLLQIFCEKGVAASRKLGRQLPLAIMTSPFNDKIIRSYLESHHFFGLSPEQVDIFPQEIMPFLDNHGNWILETPGKIASGPDGNGHSLKRFFQNGIWKKWKERGIECVNVVPIDNPLADPFDTELVGYHTRQENDVTIKAVFRHDPNEKVGVIGLKNNKIGIREYSELPANSQSFTLANIGLFCLDIDFINTIASISLPWHLARKKAPVLCGTAKGYCQEMALIWKFETFIFDILDYAKKASVLVFPREHTYAPLKNALGDKSLATVQAALLAADKHVFSRLTGNSPPEKAFELDQAFHYPTEAFSLKWAGKPLPEQDYVEDEV